MSASAAKKKIRQMLLNDPHCICHNCFKPIKSTVDMYVLEISGKNRSSLDSYVLICNPCLNKHKLHCMTEDRKTEIKKDFDRKMKRKKQKLAKQKLLKLGPEKHTDTATSKVENEGTLNIAQATPNKRPKISAKKRCFLYKLHKGICGYCGKSLDILEFTIDHIVPWSTFTDNAKHTANLMSNLLIACGPCNAEKGYLSLEEYRNKKLKFPFEIKENENKESQRRATR